VSRPNTHGIKDSTDSGFILGLFFGAVFSAIAIFVLSGIRSDHSSLVLTVFVWAIFCGASAPFLMFSFLMVRHKREFGTARLFLDESPAVVGTALGGMIVLLKPFRDFKQVELRLICTRNIPGNKFIIQRKLGRVVSSVPSAQVSISTDLMSIPVKLAIPDISRARKSKSAIVWELEVEALPKKRKGLFYDHFQTSFKVPIAIPKN
jgi:hypothetical protein